MSQLLVSAPAIVRCRKTERRFKMQVKTTLEQQAVIRGFTVAYGKIGTFNEDHSDPDLRTSILIEIDSTGQTIQVLADGSLFVSE